MVLQLSLLPGACFCVVPFLRRGPTTAMSSEVVVAWLLFVGAVCVV